MPHNEYQQFAASIELMKIIGGAVVPEGRDGKDARNLTAEQFRKRPKNGIFTSDYNEWLDFRTKLFAAVNNTCKPKY